MVSIAHLSDAERMFFVTLLKQARADGLGLAWVPSDGRNLRPPARVVPPEGGLMDTLARDLRFALRRLSARPGFAAVAIVSLALGIGANTAIFTLLDEILFSPPPYRDVDSLVEVYPAENGEVGLNAFSYPELLDLEEGTRKVFSSVAARAFTLVQENLDGSTESLSAELVTGNWFGALGFEPVAGRSFLPEEDETPGTHPVVMLGHAYWQRRFGGDPGAVGREIRLNGRPYTIVGVAPPEAPAFLPGIRTDLYVPVMMSNQIQGMVDSNQLEQPGIHNLFVKARLADGANLAAAQTALDGVVARTQSEHPDYPDEWGLVAVPTRRWRSTRSSTACSSPPARSWWRWCCWCSQSRAPTSPPSSSPRPPTGARRSPCASPWAPTGERWCASSSPRRSCWRSPGAPPASCSPSAASSSWAPSSCRCRCRSIWR